MLSVVMLQSEDDESTRSRDQTPTADTKLMSSSPGGSLEDVSDTFQKKCVSTGDSDSRSVERSNDSKHEVIPAILSSNGGDSPNPEDSASKQFAPSLASSGYGSQAISTQTLSSEDSSSAKSVNVDDVAIEVEHRPGLPVNTHSKKYAVITEFDKSAASIHPSSAKPIVQQESLIDSEIPDNNLGSPLKPTTPFKDSNTTFTDLAACETDSNTTFTDFAACKTVITETQQRQKHFESTCISSVDGYPTLSTLVRAEDGCRSDEHVFDDNHLTSRTDVLENIVIYAISKDTKANLESSALNNDCADTAVCNVNGDVKVDFKNVAVKLDFDIIHDATCDQPDTVDASQPGAGSEGDKSSSQSELKQSSIGIKDNGAVKVPEINIRMSMSLDIGKTPTSSGVKARLRGGDRTPGKTAPSPMKATYRPTGSPAVDMLAVAEKENGSSQEELYSGRMTFLSFF